MLLSYYFAAKIQLCRLNSVSIVGCFASCSETASFFENKGSLGCRPNLLGDFIPKPLLRFALSLQLLGAKQYENSIDRESA